MVCVGILGIFASWIGEMRCLSDDHWDLSEDDHSVLLEILSMQDNTMELHAVKVSRKPVLNTIETKKYT